MEIKKMVVPFEIKEFSEDGEFFIFKGYASTFGNVDRGGDVILPGAFIDSIAEMKRLGDFLPVVWQHNSDEPIGIYTAFYEDTKGLWVEGKLPKEDTFVSGRVIPQMKVGSVRKLSIGYSVWMDGGSFEIRDDVRFISKLVLWEVSPVTIPMNNEADILEMKALVPFQDLPLADRDKPWNASAAKARVKTWAGANEGLDSPSIQKKYSKAFLWYDKEEADTFAAYKLPIADVIDGKLTAIPRGIFAAAGVMRGARGGVDIPEADKAGVIKHIERYYSKMDMESPFKEGASFRIDDFKSLSDRELEGLLKAGVCFSSQNTKVIISTLKAAGLRDEDSAGHRDGEFLGGVFTELKNIQQELEENNG